MVKPGIRKAVEVHAQWPGLIILVGVVLYSFAVPAQVRLPEEGKKVNPNQERIDEPLPLEEHRLENMAGAPDRLVVFRHAKEKAFIKMLRATPGENVSKYDRGEPITEAELTRVEQKFKRVLKTHEEALGEVALGQEGKFILQPFLKAAEMYEVIPGEKGGLSVVYVNGLAIQPVAEIAQGGTISRKHGVLKDWLLPEFPERWPFLGAKQEPVFPASATQIDPKAETAIANDVVLSKTQSTAPAMPENALGWAYPLARGGMLGADALQKPPTGDVLWLLSDEAGGVVIQYSGPTKKGVYATVDSDLKIHWTSNEEEELSEEDADYWPFVEFQYESLEFARCMPIPSGSRIFVGAKNLEGGVFGGTHGNLIAPDLLKRIVKAKKNKGKGVANVR